ncbi:hypothetical protein [Winogradskyella sp. 3972H.M.0a.05]|uniref:hypothetical protein n=1 Tax=Winogradskyella sp. 3972H.M.0a.05 TaxID=2950277 RepID=UPI003390AB44
MRYLTIFIVALLTVFGCKSDVTEKGDFAYFGGEIINPNNDFVTLHSPQMKAEDTIYLDKNNRFIHKIKDVNPGIYIFTHGGEYQMIVMEPMDSLMIRLNTFDFDESLVFSGLGSKKNNFFIKDFLNNEVENKKLVDYCKLEPEAFDELMEEKRKDRLKTLETFLEKKPCSDLFVKIAKARINYNHYANREIYPFGYFGYNRLVHVKDLPESFYDFRKKIDYDADYLGDTYTYNRFLSWHFNNLALYSYYKDDHSHVEFNRYSKPYNVAKLELIDSLITNEYIKNNLLKYSVREFIYRSDDYLVSEDLLKLYLSKSSNKEDKSEIKELAYSLKKLMPGNKIPNTTLIDYNGNPIELETLIDAPTVIYFWNSNFKMHYRNSHYTALKLKELFPEVNFIAINVNEDNSKYWKSTLDQFEFPTDNEYRFKFPKDGKKIFGVGSIDKVIILKDDQTIVKSNANLFGEKFSHKLAQLVQ